MKNRIYSIICLLLSVLNADGSKAYDFIVDNIYFSKTTDSTCYVAAKDFDLYGSSINGDAYIGNIIIPPSVVYDGKTLEVVGISADAFYGCSRLTGISMPETILSIGLRAFKGCGGLKSITIPQNVLTIDEYCFDGCSNLTSVVWKAKNCTFINLRFSDERPFSDAPLSEFVIEKGVESLPYRLLRNKSGIKELIIPESVKSIGKEAFYYCTGLKSLRIPDNVEVINENVLSGINVETLVLGKNVRYIDDNNNFSVSKFFKIYAENPPVIVDRTKHTIGTALILVPYNKLEEYKYEWDDFLSSSQGYNYLPIVDADICFYESNEFL